MLKLGLLLSWKGKFSDFISCFPIPLFYFVFYCNSLPGGFIIQLAFAFLSHSLEHA